MKPKSSLPTLNIKRTMRISGRVTSLSLEDAFWKALKEIAATKGIFIKDLVSMIDNERQHANLSSAIHVFVLDYYRGQV
jgi:predicted DNA-binding ribbon-helix-helix protein